MAVNAIFRYAQFASVWLWREAERTDRARVYPSSYTAEFNERFREILAITRSVGWGASYTRSYYDGDLKDTSLEIQTNRMALLLPQILLSITTSSRDYKLIWAMKTLPM